MVNLQKCVITGCEIVSDAYKMDEDSSIGSWMVDAEYVIDDDEYGETAGEKVLNVAKTFSYTKVEYTKKEYITYFKGYIKRVMEYLQKENPDSVAQFKKDAMAFIKKFQSVSKEDLEFWMNESNDPTGYVIWSYWKDPETSSAPTFVYFKYGLKLYKC